jgi:hypothetical protein
MRGGRPGGDERKEEAGLTPELFQDDTDDGGDFGSGESGEDVEVGREILKGFETGVNEEGEAAGVGDLVLSDGRPVVLEEGDVFDEGGGVAGIGEGLGRRRDEAEGGADPVLLEMGWIFRNVELRLNGPGDAGGCEGVKKSVGEVIERLVGALLADAVDDEDGNAFVHSASTIGR